MMRNKLGKRILAGVLTLAVAVLGFVYVPDEVQAAETVVKYQKVDNETFVGKIGKTAPAYVPEDATDNTGYLFAGWYEIGENDAVGGPIEKADNITGQVYAKFIPSYLTGIACQVDLNNDSAKRNMRVVSLVDSDNYKAVGFNVYGRYDTNGDKTNETEWSMYTYSSDSENPNKAQSKDIYSGLYQYTEAEDGTMTKEIKYPKDVFGTAAEGFFFTTVSIAGITSDFFDATMAVKPYWITLDGTYVEGMGEFNRINDYEDKIVNVSVNLKDATAIAAGMLNITVPEGFIYTSVEVEGGRVFEEMESAVSGNTIKCVGNVSTAANSTKANEVYVNLRFSVDSLATVTKGATEFAVDIPTNGFCSIEEAFDTGVEAWNVKY